MLLPFLVHEGLYKKFMNSVFVALFRVGPTMVKACKSFLYTDIPPKVEIKNTWFYFSSLWSVEFWIVQIPL